MSAPSYDWSKHPLFEGLPAGYIQLLASTARVEKFEPRELIVHEDEPAEKFYLITEGNVVIEIFANGRGPVMIQSVGVGEVLGWSWLVAPFRWHFDARATTATEAIVFDGQVVRSSFASHPDFGYIMLNRFVPIIVQRLQAMSLQLLDVYHAHA